MSDRFPKRPMLLLQHRQDIQKGKGLKRKRSRREEMEIEEHKSAPSSASSLSSDDHTTAPALDPPVQPAVHISLSRSKPVERTQQIDDEEPRRKQRWTELTAAGHILSDEVHKYLNPQEGSDPPRGEISLGECRQLTMWVDAVENKLYRQSGIVLENVSLVTTLRQALSKVQGLRDDLLVLRTQARRLREEADQLKLQLGRSKENSTARQGASRLLWALENVVRSIDEEAF